MTMPAPISLSAPFWLVPPRADFRLLHSISIFIFSVVQAGLESLTTTQVPVALETLQGCSVSGCSLAPPGGCRDPEGGEPVVLATASADRKMAPRPRGAARRLSRVPGGTSVAEIFSFRWLAAYSSPTRALRPPPRGPRRRAAAMKKFFQEIKADIKFKSAGPGQKLTDSAGCVTLVGRRKRARARQGLPQGVRDLSKLYRAGADERAGCGDGRGRRV